MLKLTELDEPGLFLLGIELLDSAGQTLFETLERQLKPLFGEDWFFQSLVRNPEDRELAPRDLSVLLVQIEIRNNSNFRLALRTEYNDGKPHDKIYFEHLTDLRITRNEWFHRIINPITSEELFDLSKTITEVFPPHSQIAIKAKKLYDLLSSDEFTAVDLLRTSRYVGSYVSKLEEIQEIRRQEQELEEIMIETHSEHLVNRLRLHVAQDETTATSDLVQLLFAEQENGVTSYRTSQINPLGGLSQDWPRGFLDVGSDEAGQLFRQTVLRQRQISSKKD